MAISAVAGMGGVGKTELAIQYGRRYGQDYAGGVCWLTLREQSLAVAAVTEFVRRFEKEIPSQDAMGRSLELEDQVRWCWEHWQPEAGAVLLILDDVPEMAALAGFRELPERFRVLLTTRVRGLDANFHELDLDTLERSESLALLNGILTGPTTAEEIAWHPRLQAEQEAADTVCMRLGDLPLGLELVGRYLKRVPRRTVAEVLQKLIEQGAGAEPLNPNATELEKSAATAWRGVEAAFELTWDDLGPEARELALVVGLFVPSAVPWVGVEAVAARLGWNDLAAAEEQLVGLHVLLGEGPYNVHPLVRGFLLQKLAEAAAGEEYRRAFAATVVGVAEQIPQTLTLEDVERFRGAIPHLQEVAEQQLDAVADKDLLGLFAGIAGYYEGQGSYKQAEKWGEDCRELVEKRLGKDHPDYAQSLNNLAYLYHMRGKHDRAVLMHKEALELRSRILGKEHPDYAESLNNLAYLYRVQENYNQAKPLYEEALKLWGQLLGKNHLNYIQCLNNLAGLYDAKEKYDQAQPLYEEALELASRVLGKDHPLYALILSNLAGLYQAKEEYDRAQPLYEEALELRSRILGKDHPHYTASLSNLAYLYRVQEKYKRAQPLCEEALDLTGRISGKDHPDYATSLNRLAIIHAKQGAFDTALPLMQQAISIRRTCLGNEHPDTQRAAQILQKMLRDMEAM